jgi:hypothetical protein
MTLRQIAAGLSLIVALNLALAPSVAVAGGRGIVGRPIMSHPHHPFVGRPFVQHHVFPHHFFRPFVPFVGVVVPPLGYYAPYYSTPTYPDSSYYSPPVYAAPPPAYYNPPVSYAPPSYAPPAGSTISVAPVPNVVEYPNGRYVLRGDGTTTPYTWVWIPNPPPAPPASPPAGSPPPSDPPSRRPTSLYRWIDERGDIHLTDSLDMVPKKFRIQAKETQL